MSNHLSHPIQKEEMESFRRFLYELQLLGEKYLLRNDIMLAFKAYCDKTKKDSEFRESSSIAVFLNKVQEMIFFQDSVIILHRPQIAKFKAYVISETNDRFEEITTLGYLNYKDQLVDQWGDMDPESKLRLDFLPFYDYGPSLRDPKKIGKGIQFLNQYISGSFLKDPKIWAKHIYEFLKIHALNEKQLLIDGSIITHSDQLIETVNDTILYLDNYLDKSLEDINPELRRRGILEGFGNSPAKIKETLQLLLDLFDAHLSETLENFMARIPMVSKIAVISPHGWFAQGDVLGRPDTGGQVVYILEQVKYLEREMIEQYESAGINITPKIIVLTRLIPENDGTTCNQRLEKIHGTENCWILRVPFHDKKGNIVPQWISRFKIWPYLERFTSDSKRELAAEFAGRPDLIIGNYSDGNIVASYLAKHFRVVQCNIAHALEKTKYESSALYWKEHEEHYHFSLQFLADLISMNMANFIITSTRQEITGTETTLGQYESYLSFTLPGMYHVDSGINLYHPKFNVIPPGVDEEINFPYYQEKKRVTPRREKLNKMLFEDTGKDILGHLKDPDKPSIFSMARLDKIKNITGLVEAYAKSRTLQKKANLIIIAGTLDEKKAQDREEILEIQKMYDLIKDYKLDGKMRWLCQKPKKDTGEIYRLIADRRGVFVQPALYEAFGLTILEAMHCGLPTFATQFGGPVETIEDGITGFLINPTRPELISEPLTVFFTQCKKDSEYWKKISDAGIQRAQTSYTWKLYSQNLLTLSKIYGFWKYTASAEGKRDMIRYCDVLYYFLLHKRSEEMLEDSD